MERDNVTSVLQDIGAVVLANACGPCIGQVCNLTPSNADIQYIVSSGNEVTMRRMKMVRV